MCSSTDIRSAVVSMPEKQTEIQAILFDLGNVVVEVDFRRTFRHWAASAEVEETHFHAHWSEDDAYRAHERGELTFAEYADALSQRLGVTMSPEQWQAGWNDVFVGPYPGVQEALARLRGSFHLYAFTNTNPTHEAAWRSRYRHALDHFQEIFVSSSIGMRKPDEAAFHWVAAAMGMRPEQILFLDDNAANVDGAARAGLRTARVNGEAEVLEALKHF